MPPLRGFLLDFSMLPADLFRCAGRGVLGRRPRRVFYVVDRPVSIYSRLQGDLTFTFRVQCIDAAYYLLSGTCARDRHVPCVR